VPRCVSFGFFPYVPYLTQFVFACQEGREAWYNPHMSTASYLDRFLNPVADAFTPELARKLADLRADEELQSHVDGLAKKANDGTITAAEDAEYKALIDAADLVAVLQLKARRFLAQPPA